MWQTAKFIVKLWQNGQEIELHQATGDLSDNDQVNVYLIESVNWLDREALVAEYTWFLDRRSLFRVRDIHNTQAERNRAFSKTAWNDKNGRTWIIEDNERAQKVEVKPIPCPTVKDGVQTMFFDGHWHKLLKKGWVKL